MVSGGGWVRMETDHKCTNIYTRRYVKETRGHGLISLSIYLLGTYVTFSKRSYRRMIDAFFFLTMYSITRMLLAYGRKES